MLGVLVLDGVENCASQQSIYSPGFDLFTQEKEHGLFGLTTQDEQTTQMCQVSIEFLHKRVLTTGRSSMAWPVLNTGV